MPAQPLKRPPIRATLRVLGALLLAYGAFVLLMAGCQRHYIYFPATESRPALENKAGELDMVPWIDPDDQAFLGWRPEAGQAEPPGRRMVVFHGNAGNALDRTYFADCFSTVGGGAGEWEVFLFEYPGYGARAGAPSEATFVEAADRAVETLLDEDDRPLYLLGESLGSGVATRLARNRPERIAGLVLITPFTDLAAVGRAHFPFLPVGLLLRDRYDNVANLRDYRQPVAILLAGQDEVVPARLGRTLHENYRGPKKLWVQEGASHNTLLHRPGDPIWQEMTEFLDPPPPPAAR
ncbi:MAG: alpha/beta hydrolase [Opitutales bacterium]